MACRRCVRLLLHRRPPPMAAAGGLIRRAYFCIPNPLLPPPITTPRHHFHPLRLFSSSTSGRGSECDEGEESDEEEAEVDPPASSCVVERAKVGSSEEAAAIGYKVVGRVDGPEDVFKPWEPVYAVIQIGSHQFKVSNGDTIYTERLKHCDINDKLVLNKVLMLGSKAQTIIGKPILPDASVHAVVEEHALDAKVIIFKKKRRKNYRRTKGHRQELTRLRITDIEGIDKPELEIAS